MDEGESKLINRSDGSCAGVFIFFGVFYFQIIYIIYIYTRVVTFGI